MEKKNTKKNVEMRKMMHKEVCDEHLKEGYNLVYYGSFCLKCDLRYEQKNKVIKNDRNREPEAPDNNWRD